MKILFNSFLLCSLLLSCSSQASSPPNNQSVDIEATVQARISEENAIATRIAEGVKKELEKENANAGEVKKDLEKLHQELLKGNPWNRN